VDLPTKGLVGTLSFDLFLIVRQQSGIGFLWQESLSFCSLVGISQNHAIYHDGTILCACRETQIRPPQYIASRKEYRSQRGTFCQALQAFLCKQDA